MRAGQAVTEYRDVLTKLTPQQMNVLSDGIHLGGNTDVDSMMKIFEMSVRRGITPLP